MSFCTKSIDKQYDARAKYECHYDKLLKHCFFFAPISFAPCRRESFNKVIIALKHPYFTYELNLRSLFRSLSYTFKSAHMSYRIKKILLYICCFSSGMNFAPEGGGEQMWMGEGGAMFCRSGGAVGLVTLCRGNGEGSD